MNNNEQSNKKRTTGILLSILAIISLVLITAGVTYAFFSYAKEGLTENVLTTGTITFYYDETAGLGKSINITEALPLDDNAGMKLTSAEQVFDFQITSEVSSGAKIPYMITVRKASTSTLTGDKVKVYLEALSGSEFGSSITSGTQTYPNVIKEGDTNHTFKQDSDITLFSELQKVNNSGEETSGTTVTNGDTSNKVKVTVPKDIDERIIYEGVVPTNSITSDSGTQKYTANFRLRMWINGEQEDNVAAADYSAYEFVKKTATQNGNGEALDAEKLINSNEFITSTAYYAKSDNEREQYERIAFVDQKAGKFYSVTQASNKKWITVDAQTGQIAKQELGEEQPGGNFQFSEQYYSLNGKTFKLTVNVYANAVVVDGE